MIIKVYKFRIEALEPLSLGNGENKYSDKDLIRDGRGCPFIPGSALRGVYRSLFEPKLAETYFGSLEGEQEERKRRIVVYDAVVDEEVGFKTAIRDSVQVDAFKVTKKGAKFDFEVVEPGAMFTTYLEQWMESEEELDVGAVIAKQYQRGKICFGGKTQRGYGKVAAIKSGIWVKRFVLPENGEETSQFEETEEKEIKEKETKEKETKEKAGLEEWLDFDMYNPKAFDERDVYYEEQETEHVLTKSMDLVTIKLELKQKSGISIRKYTTELTSEGEGQPDFTQMFYQNQNGEKIPYIQGTTWTGAFRHHMTQILSSEGFKKEFDVSQNTSNNMTMTNCGERTLKTVEDFISQYFGSVSGTSVNKSKVRFSESKIEGTIPKVMTRTAIDRFTGGAVGGALYTERTFFDGETMLSISFPLVGEKEGVLWNKLLATSIADLDAGFLAVGGLTAAGRGLFHVKRCWYNEEEIYQRSDKEGQETFDETTRLYQTIVNVLHAGEEIQI